VGFFPYPPRAFQEVAQGIVASTARDRGHLVLEMPTGSGKTVVLLAGALAAAKELGKRVLYVSRTNSQQEQTMREFNQIRKASGLPLRAYALQGRSRLCVKLEDAADAEWQDATPEELSHFCAGAKAATDQDPTSSRACRYWAGLERTTPEQLLALVGEEGRTAEWMKQNLGAQSICPYEATKRLIFNADLVIVPYVFAFDTTMRRRLMELWGCAETDVILVVDEAHNVPSYLRESNSPSLTREKLRRALAESKELGHPEVARKVSSQAFLENLSQAIEGLVVEYCKEEDGFIPPFELETQLLTGFATTTRGLHDAANVLFQLGEIIRDRRRLMGRIPRTHLGQVGAFLQRWIGSDDDGFVKLAGREPTVYLEAFMVDTARCSEIFTSFHASIHASGTLTPLEEYRDSLGLPEETRLERFPSPFPDANLTVRGVNGITTRYEALKSDPQAVDALQESIRTTVESIRVSAACFFPSHRLMEECRELGIFASRGDRVLFEDRQLGQQQLMEMVARHRERAGDSLIVGVLGGRLSEGLDFPGRQLEAIIVVGMPFPKPTAHQRALFHYHEVRHGKGWDYAVRAPALRRLRQALGRLIRSETDRGFALILDERAAPFLSSAGIECQAADLTTTLAEFRTWQAESAVQAPARRYA
jgi:DNA excision repair protein ERCC-2